jgi:hypothetical protein
MSGLAANPGTLGLFSAYADSSRPQSVTLESITLLPLAGFRLPRLVSAGLLTAGSYPARTSAWPPPGASLSALTGAVVWPAARAGGQPPQIVYALSGSQLGGYATAGLRLEYRFDGRDYSAVLRDAAFLWYFSPHLSPAADKADGARYLAANSRAYKAFKARGS